MSLMLFYTNILLIYLVSFVYDAHGSEQNMTQFGLLLMKQYGTNMTLSADELDQFLQLSQFTRSSGVEFNSSDLKCASAADIFASVDLVDKRADVSHMTSKLLPWILYQLQSPSCSSFTVSTQANNTSTYTKSPPEKMWGYGLLFVTLINLCATFGIIIIPFMKRRFYKLIMTFMVSLAVGSLAGSALLFLIPDAMQLAEIEQEHPKFGGYLWKSTVVFGGVYAFFILERLLKILIDFKWNFNTLAKKLCPSQTKEEYPSCSVTLRRDPKPDEELKIPPELHLDGCRVVTDMETTDHHSVDVQMDCSGDKANGDNAQGSLIRTVSITNGNKSRSRNNSGVGHSHGGHDGVAPVAWMIILGDGVHNFIDGLSLGAAFSRSILTGISLSVAVLCEELPHELGDFAILLNSGMSVKKAMLMNLVSASTCYLGFCVGALLGEMPSASLWVFAFAGGMFLYISLVDMLPEMNHAMEAPETKSLGRKNIFFLQNLGLLCGFGVLLFLAVYGDAMSLV